jgi:hypothetical protein
LNELVQRKKSGSNSAKRRNQIGNKTDPLNGLAGDESLAYKDCQII